MNQDAVRKARMWLAVVFLVGARLAGYLDIVSAAASMRR